MSWRRYKKIPIDVTHDQFLKGEPFRIIDGDDVQYVVEESDLGHMVCNYDEREITGISRHVANVESIKRTRGLAVVYSIAAFGVLVKSLLIFKTQSVTK